MTDPAAPQGGAPRVDDAAVAPRAGPPSAAPRPPAAPASGGRSIASEVLFAGASEVQINHRGSLYRLKQTALGKLILTK